MVRLSVGVREQSPLHGHHPRSRATIQEAPVRERRHVHEAESPATDDRRLSVRFAVVGIAFGDRDQAADAGAEVADHFVLADAVELASPCRLEQDVTYQLA